MQVTGMSSEDVSSELGATTEDLRRMLGFRELIVVLIAAVCLSLIAILGLTVRSVFINDIDEAEAELWGMRANAAWRDGVVPDDCRAFIVDASGEVIRGPDDGGWEPPAGETTNTLTSAIRQAMLGGSATTADIDGVRHVLVAGPSPGTDATTILAVPEAAYRCRGDAARGSLARLCAFAAAFSVIASATAAKVISWRIRVTVDMVIDGFENAEAEDCGS